MRTVLRLLITVAGLAATNAAAASPVQAEEVAEPFKARAEARQRTDQARLAYERGDYHGASADYAEAYRLDPSPGVLFNLAQSYRQDGRCSEAATAYRGVLRSNLVGPARDMAEQQLAAVEVCVRALDLSDVRSDRRLRRNGLTIMAVGGGALVVATGFALADGGADSSTGSLSVGLALGGGAALATGVVVYAVAQQRLRGRERHDRPQLGVFRVPVGTTRVAGATWKF